MPREARDLAILLLAKAATDVSVVHTLVRAEEAYEAIGFRAQQACERAIKAVLASGIGVPAGVEEIGCGQGPYAGQDGFEQFVSWGSRRVRAPAWRTSRAGTRTRRLG